MTSNRAKTVAIFDASADTVEMLKTILAERGHRAIAGAVDQVKSGQIDLIELLRTHRPDAIIWDIAPPYDRNWNFFHLVRHVDVVRHCALVLTTTNKQRLEELIGHQTDALELVGKPYDLELIADAAERLMAASTRSAPFAFERRSASP